MKDPRPSDEILSAFVDGQFSPEDRLLTLQLIASDEKLSREVCDLYQLKELISNAYRLESLPAPVTHPAKSARGRIGWPAIAAGVAVLALGSAALFELTHGSLIATFPLQSSQVTGNVAGSTPLLAINTDAPKVLFHVTEVEGHSAGALFDDIEYLFATALLQGQTLNVQMVVHGPALDLVRVDLAPFPHRLDELLRTYPGFRVTACNQSLIRSQEQEGLTITLLPRVEPVESGVREAARLQAEGWTYIRV